MKFHFQSIALSTLNYTETIIYNNNKNQNIFRFVY